MDSKSSIIEKINLFLPFFNEDFLISISNKGTYKRSLKDLEKIGEENINISLTENEELKVEFEDVSVVLNNNIQNSLCSCPASGICKHILISLLFLEKYYEKNKNNNQNEMTQNLENVEKIEKIQNIEETKINNIKKNNESQNDKENDDFKELTELTRKELLEMIGEKTYNSLLKSLFIIDNSEITKEEMIWIAKIKNENVNIYFPKVKTIQNSMCSCGKKGICSHKAYVLLSYLIKNKKITKNDLEIKKIEFGEKELEFISLIKKFVASILDKGITNLVEIEIEKAEKYYIQAYGLGFFSLANELKNLSSELKFYFEKNISFSNKQLLHTLCIIFNRANSLTKINNGTKQSILLGKKQEEKFSLNGIEIFGVGANAVITKRKDLLVTAYFYSKDLESFLTMSTLRPFENLYQIKTLFGFNSVWSDEYSFKMVSNSKILLKDAKLSTGKVSTSKLTKGIIERKTENEDFEKIAITDYLEILDNLKENKFNYFEFNSQNSNIFLVKVEKIENIIYDEISQKLKFDCFDKNKNKIQFSINYDLITAKLISNLEKCKELKFDYILGKLNEKNNEIFGTFLDSITDGKINNLYFDLSFFNKN